MRASGILAVVVICAIVPVHAASFDFPPDATSPRSFEHWLRDLTTEARERGYGEELLARTLGGLQATAAGDRQLATGRGSRPSGCRAMREMTAARSFAEWRRLGLRRADGRALPSTPRPARLVAAGRRQFLVDENYDARLRYNCAHHDALSVALLADRIR